MKEFRLKFRLAELKEKSDKLEEALEEYTWALYYEWVCYIDKWNITIQLYYSVYHWALTLQAVF